MQRTVLAFRADATGATANIPGLNSSDISITDVAAADRFGGARHNMFLSVTAFLE
jgi:Flp pilus assembly pilin Flp